MNQTPRIPTWLAGCLSALVLATALGSNALSAELLDPKLDAWPFFYYGKAHDGRWRVEVMWPFFEKYEDAEWKATIFRPFWNARHEKGKDYHDSELIWPLGRTTVHGNIKHEHFFPLYFLEEEKKPDGTVEKSLTFLPFLFKTKREKEERSGLWPFYGKFKKYKGRDVITFVMWPIYIHQRKDDTEVTNILWPFFSFSKCEGGGGWKFWPFYGKKEKKDKYVKEFILWPFYSHQKVHLEKGGTYEIWLGFLIGGKERSPDGSADSTIWPFFQHIVDKKKGTVKDYFPWPFLVRARGKNYKHDQVWPFFITTERGKNQSVVILWPIAWFNKGETIDSTTKSARVLPFWYSADEKWQKDGTTDKYLQVWPLFHRSQKRDTKKSLESLSPIWLRENDGWERNWAPFFWVFQTDSEPIEGGTERIRSQRLMWRVVHHESSPYRKTLRIKPIFLRIVDEDGKRHLCLPGGFLKIPLGKGRTRPKEKS